MSKTTAQLDAGGLVSVKTKQVDAAATEQIVARTYGHPSLGERPVIRLASDRLGQAEDLAMEFLGFDAPAVSKPLAIGQRRSLGFAAWALINDPDNAHYALDLVKRMKATARKAKSKPGHAWDTYTEMGKELGRSARHFLPPFWEEAGRTYKDFGNQTYAGRALTKSLEAERVHALESDRARRRDVVLEFVLAGCLAGKALSEYTDDLLAQYPADEAFVIFRDLCTRRTLGGMPPWAALPKDLIKIAKAAKLDGNEELEKWLEEVIDTPAMGRTANQFWKYCSKHCARIVAHNPAFAVALLRHTKPVERYYGESKVGVWLDLLASWGVFEFLWEDEHKDAPPLGEPVAIWFGRIVRDEVPAPARTLEMLEKLSPRLKQERTPLPLSIEGSYHSDEIDIDVLEAALVLGIKVEDPPSDVSVKFDGWLAADQDHSLRNQDLVKSWRDDRFCAAIMTAMDEALTCRGASSGGGWNEPEIQRQAFPLAAADRAGITELWCAHATSLLDQLEGTGLASFKRASDRLKATFWPDTLRLFPHLAERLAAIDPVEVLQRTLQAGVFDEYGLPGLEKIVDEHGVKIRIPEYGDSNLSLTFPDIVVVDKVHAYVSRSNGEVEKHELHLPKSIEDVDVTVVGNDFAVNYRDKSWNNRFFWLSDPKQKYEAEYRYEDDNERRATQLADGSVFLGQHAVRSGDKKLPGSENYFHDGDRFWRLIQEYDNETGDWLWSFREVDPETGKAIRESVPPWFEKTDGGMVAFGLSELMPAPAGAEDFPLGVKNGLIGWKSIQRRDGSFCGEGIDGRRWEQPLLLAGQAVPPVGLLQQPGTDEFLPMSGDDIDLWDATGSTVVADLSDIASYAGGQATVLPTYFWHLLQLRDESSSKILRSISLEQCSELLNSAGDDRDERHAARGAKRSERSALPRLTAAVKALLPKAPPRMVLGVARVVELAELEGIQLIIKREKMAADSKKKSTPSTLAASQKVDEASAHWGLKEVESYGESTASLSTHLQEVAEFLKGEANDIELPRTKHVWFAILDDLSNRCWQVLWHVTANKNDSQKISDVTWLPLLEFWRDLGIAELPGEFAVMVGLPPGAKKKHGSYDVEVNSGRAFTIVNGKDRFVAIENNEYDADFPYYFLRYSTADAPGDPPGFEVKKVVKLKNDFDRDQVDAFITAVKLLEEPPLPTKQELADVAETLKASPTEIGLIWMSGVGMDSDENNFLPANLRKALGCKVIDAAAARQSLQNLKQSVRSQLFSAVVSRGMAAPLADDRGPVLDAIEKVWRAKMPKRLPLEAAMQKRLSSLCTISRWQSVDHEVLLAIAAEPTMHPLLQPTQIEIRSTNTNYRNLELQSTEKKRQIIGVDELRSIVQLVAMIHSETAAAHDARAYMPGLIKQTTALLNSSKVLLSLQQMHFYGEDQKKKLTPVEWANQYLGKTKIDSKDRLARYDDELISGVASDAHHMVMIGFRPAKLNDESDLTRLLGIHAMGAGEEFGYCETAVPVVSLIKSPGFQKLFKSVVADHVPPDSWCQHPLHTAPNIVEQVQKKHKVGEEAAILYAQVLALPDPTTANVRRWNDWSAATYKKAMAELLKRKLVLEAKRARAGRTIFLPGEWTELKSPWLPIETWKVSHLVEVEFDSREPFPVGGPMVLRPFEDLFAAAWQRVCDGDVPRYEEVKRKRSKKK